jgi:glutathione synthase/RimK-type ligase-like ATP-grasp enzyme
MDEAAAIKPTGRVGVAVPPEFDFSDPEWLQLRAALADAGLEPSIVQWAEGKGTTDDCDVMLVSHCWDYVTRRDDFLDWAARVAAAGTRLANPLSALRWSSDKAYLADLQAAGVPIVPTAFVAPGESWTRPADDFVVKPAVGSGGRSAARYLRSPPGVAEEHVAALHADGQTVLVQPYQPAVDSAGETAVVFLGGRFSHAFRKEALLGPDVGVVERLWERMVLTPVDPRPDQLAAAEAAMAAATALVGTTAYGRVDLLDADADTDTGPPVVLEVELVEPALFLAGAPGAAARLAAVISAMACPDHGGRPPPRRR